MTYEEVAIKWCEERTRLYAALAEAFRLVGPVMAKKHDEDLLKLFVEDSKR